MDEQFEFTEPKKIIYDQKNATVKQGKKNYEEISNYNFKLSSKSLLGVYNFVCDITNRQELRKIYCIDGYDSDFQTKSKQKFNKYTDLLTIKNSLENGEISSLEDAYEKITEYFKLFDALPEEKYKSEKDITQFINNNFQQQYKDAVIKTEKEVNQKLIDILQNISKSETTKLQETEETPQEREKLIAQYINKLDEKQRIKAEWIIKIHVSNKVPYYSSSVRVTDLPSECIQELIKEFRIPV